jgi:acetate kinase
MIVAHLGSGCSAAAIVDGKSIDTTMGFTPMEGLVMSTRAGTIDPGLMIHLLNKSEFSEAANLSNLLNKKSGLLGLSGQSADMKELLHIEKLGGDRSSCAHEAVEVFVYSVQKYIGQLMASLEYDFDAIVFTGGIGENSPELRARIIRAFSNYGILVDREANQSPGERGIISTEASKVRVFAVKTNEEFQIARDSLGLISF